MNFELDPKISVTREEILSVIREIKSVYYGNEYVLYEDRQVIHESIDYSEDVDNIELNQSFDYEKCKYVEKFWNKYDSKYSICDIDYDNIMNKSFDDKNEYVDKFWSKLGRGGYGSYDISYMMDKLFNHEIDKIHEYVDLHLDYIGHRIIFSFTDYGQTVYCKIEIYDDLSPNRWDSRDYKCEIYLNVKYATKLNELIDKK